ncbi:hypothetical protein [Streptomyces sp. 8L]|uniref:hypothetical protein n=1 Tax=Streptomyces sp. 8L TaxID=2877242 RepID=UPI001CD1F4A3|nr:hypothetical protein [Streptomyces sp. 8L]MCA1223445.1 hypothetical protein [Streptomyces sp. 8L]
MQNLKPTYDELAEENRRLRAVVQSVRDITPYCDISVASGLLRVVRLKDIEEALAPLDAGEG